MHVGNFNTCFLYVPAGLYHKCSNCNARKKLLFTLALKYVLCKMLSFTGGTLIRVALPNWNEPTCTILNFRFGMFTRSGNSPLTGS